MSIRGIRGLCGIGVLTNLHKLFKGALWLIGRVFDLKPRGCRSEFHRHHFIVSLSKHINPCLVLVQPRKMCPNITETLLTGRQNRIKHVNAFTPAPTPLGGLGCCQFYVGGSVVVDLLFIVTPIVGVCNCSMFCCKALYVHSNFTES